MLSYFPADSEAVQQQQSSRIMNHIYAALVHTGQVALRSDHCTKRQHSI